MSSLLVEDKGRSESGDLSLFHSQPVLKSAPYKLICQCHMLCGPRLLGTNFEMQKY